MDLQSHWDQELKHEFRLKVKKLTGQIIAARAEEADAKRAWKDRRTERKIERHLIGNFDWFALRHTGIQQPDPKIER